MASKQTIKTVKKYLAALRERGLNTNRAVLYGSQSTGKQHKWSDIDLVVISPQFDRSGQQEEINMLWKVAARIDSRIEPIACGERQWMEENTSIIVELARRDGEMVLLEESEN